MDASKSRKAVLKGGVTDDITRFMNEHASDETAGEVQAKRKGVLSEVGSVATNFEEDRTQENVPKSDKRRDQINVRLAPRELEFLRTTIFTERNQHGDQFRTIKSLVQDGLHALEALRAVNLEDVGLRQMETGDPYMILLDKAIQFYVEAHEKRKHGK